jgi:hypothetical protein
MALPTVEYECGCYQSPQGAPNMCPAHNQPRKRKEDMDKLKKELEGKGMVEKARILASALFANKTSTTGIINLGEYEIRCFDGNGLSASLKTLLIAAVGECINALTYVEGLKLGVDDSIEARRRGANIPTTIEGVDKAYQPESCSGSPVVNLDPYPKANFKVEPETAEERRIFGTNTDKPTGLVGGNVVGEFATKDEVDNLR